EQCGDIYYRFTDREELGRRIRELRFPARSVEAPRRVVNLPYNSLGPLFKGRDAALVELRQRLMGGEGRAVGLTARQEFGYSRLSLIETFDRDQEQGATQSRRYAPA